MSTAHSTPTHPAYFRFTIT